MSRETVHVAFCDCADAVHVIGDSPTLAAARAAAICVSPTTANRKTN